jgi:hypothetical protein
MMELLSKINALGLDLLSELHNDGALDDDNYYSRRLNDRYFLSKKEIHLLRYIIGNFKADTSVCEIGAGFGQILLTLSILGYKTIGTEVRKDRYNASVFLKKRFMDMGFDSSGFNPTLKRYPEYTPKADVLLSANIVATFNVENANDIIRSFKDYKYVIIDTLEFGKMRASEKERAGLLEALGVSSDKRKGIGFNYFLLNTDLQYE